MTNEEAKHKLDFMKKAYQKLIDEKVDSGKLVGDGVRGEWQAKTPLDEAYKDMIEGLDTAIKALEQGDVFDKIRAEILDESEYAYADFDRYKEDILHAEPDELPDDDFRYGLERAVEIINKYRKGGAE